MFDRIKMPKLKKRGKTTKLLQAAKTGDYVTILRLLDRGHEVDDVGEDGASALHYACLEGHVSAVRVLLDADANMSITTTSGATSLHYACKRGHTNTAQLLVDKGVDIDALDNGGSSALYLCCSTGFTITAEMLLHRGGSISLRTQSGDTALHAACARGYTGTVEMLLDRGAEVNCSDNMGATPLHRASAAGCSRIVDLLLERLADPHAPDNSGRTPMDVAFDHKTRDALSAHDCRESISRENEHELLAQISHQKFSEDADLVLVETPSYDAWNNFEWDCVTIQLAFHRLLGVLDVAKAAKDRPRVLQLQKQVNTLTAQIKHNKMVPWSFFDLRSRALSVLRRVEVRYAELQTVNQVSTANRCGAALHVLKNNLHQLGILDEDCMVPSPRLTTNSSTEMSSPVVNPGSPLPPPSSPSPLAAAISDLGEYSVTTAHRVIDDHVMEDGSFRSPLAGMFPAHLPLLPVRDIFGSMISKRPYIEASIELAEKQAAAVADEYADLTLDERVAIVLYTIEEDPKENSIYFMMNESLRSEDRSTVKPWRYYIWLLLHALQKLPPSHCDSVYRGMQVGTAALGRNYVKGREFQWASFSSTTSHIDGLKAFLGPTGPRSLFHLKLTRPSLARDIRAFSLHPKENELLLPPNMMFAVEAVLDVGNDLRLFQCVQARMIDELLPL